MRHHIDITTSAGEVQKGTITLTGEMGGGRLEDRRHPHKGGKRGDTGRDESSRRHRRRESGRWEKAFRGVKGETTPQVI